MDPNTSGCSIHSSPSTASSHALTSFQSPETQLSWSDWLATVDGPEVETSTTTTTTSPDTQMPATSSSEPATSQQPPAKIRRKPVPGKGFRKTRSGCFNCKRRRVKCTETRPTCLGCRRLALDCVYPPRPESPDLCRPVRTRVPCGGTYTATVDLDHLRFFNHFLVGGHPPHPYGTGASVWKDVASLAHQVSHSHAQTVTFAHIEIQHDFLACALLGLAAQHLTLFSHADCSVQALGLRVSAIKGLNDALSRPCIAVTDTDARYAAAIILTYQSAYMPNGLMDLLHMMRGWMTISETLVLDPNDSLFRGLTRESFVGSMREYLKDLPGPKGSPMMDDFFASLSLITPLCQSDAELRYLAALENLGTLARGSPVDGE